MMKETDDLLKELAEIIEVVPRQWYFSAETECPKNVPCLFFCVNEDAAFILHGFRSELAGGYVTFEGEAINTEIDPLLILSFMVIDLPDGSVSKVGREQ
jgi:hypothetical protein